MSEKKPKHYLTNSDFYTELMTCRYNGTGISDKLSEMFMLLCEKYTNHRNFVRYYHLKDDLVCAGLVACVRCYEKFRPFKCKDASAEWEANKTPIVYHHEHCSNTFAYFTSSIRNAFIGVLKEEYNQSNIVNKMRVGEGLDASYGYVDMIKEEEEEEKRLREEEARLSVEDEENSEFELDENSTSAVDLTKQPKYGRVGDSDQEIESETNDEEEDQ